MEVQARVFDQVRRDEGMNYCFDVLAGAKYPNAVRSIPVEYGIGLFAETFGDAYPVAKQALQDGRDYIRMQLIWSDSHSFGDKDIKTIKTLAAKYEVLAKQFPEAIIELSPFCEHNVASPDKYLDIAQAAAPNCRIVNTPWKGGFSKKYKNEIHGDHKKPEGEYNFSFDGTNCVDSDAESFKKLHKGADRFFFWACRFNLKWSMKDPTPRPERKAKPSKEYIESIVYLVSDKEKTSVPKNWLVKSHAEKHGPEDKKGDKLLIISPLKTSEIVLKRNGRKVATLSYYGPYDGGGFRYYSQVMGYQLGANLEIFAGGKSYGVLNAGFRDPTFR